MTDVTENYFFELTPERVLEAVETAGLLCTGRCMALNSFENRVYDVELEGEPPTRTVAKFYRPGRWTEAQIREEHEFLFDLQAEEVPVIAPVSFLASGQGNDSGTAGLSTLHRTPTGIWFSLFPKVGGRAPEELSDDQLLRIGRLLARIHNVGARKDAPHRVKIGPESYGISNLEFLLGNNFLPLDFSGRYDKAVREICGLTRNLMENVTFQRIHGDCHLGNLLWNQNGPFFLDFDDMVRGPAVQDLWLLVPGRDPEALRQRNVLLEGYTEMRVFDPATLRLIEPLRALRFVHYAAWIARRWQDPAFPRAFPHFGTHRYWQDETEDLEEQLRLIS
ncbi:MAG: stress response serine/threonine protein kinase YihE [Bdellovibrionales bacterium GWC1_52_8]|nr:MAG: stress response serine/threonine protein kinase YihE [Bdellovibrionales bacterium GWB1_52_6]OFZ02654.1 MAG: stress response serine/threonine protein kinase YihE [Bdellovibrionales bacterium GWA1_52_35]OFZ36604.1 MAG: stress response serine/threonine protein kinase YihE [Bdellovibrionales bacterium GWC1_52_8]